MYQRKLFVFLFLLSFFLSVAQTDFKTYTNGPFPVTEFKLENGLTIMLSEKHDEPRIFGAVVVKAGGKNDPRDATGMAHYLEHMLFKGTTELGTTNYEQEKIYLDEINKLYEQLAITKDDKQRAIIQKKINDASVKAAQYAIPNEMDRMLAELGSEDVNAFTTEDLTCYFNSFASHQIYKWLDIYAHRFQNPVFRLFQSELETVYEEKNRGMDNPLEYVFEKYLEMFYKNHPYGQQTIIGKTEHLKNPSLLKMYEYYKTYYVANNMALIICGDFVSDEIIPVIKEKFGKWRNAPVPVFTDYKENEFNNRELLKLRATPIKVGAIGFRSPNSKHPDAKIIEVIAMLYTNQQRSGFLDRLSAEGKLTMAGMFSQPYNDYGSVIFYFIPKIIGQSLTKAEKIIWQEIQKVNEGKFTDEELQAIKTSLYKEFEKYKESNYQRALMMGFSFSSGRKWSDVITETELIKSITREQVIETSKKYFNENRLVLHSKMGFPKKDKLKKPGFEPVIPKEEKQSEYYMAWNDIEEKIPEVSYVDFQKDIIETEPLKNIKIFCTDNPYNHIFHLNIIYGTGKYYIPVLKLLPDYIYLADSKEYNYLQFKKELAAMGATCDFSCTDHRFIIHVEGLDENFEKTLLLINNHLNTLLASSKIVDKIAHDMLANDKINRRQPNYMAQVLTNYLLYGKASAYLREINAKEVKKYTPVQILAALDSIKNYEMYFYYTGKLKNHEVSAALLKHYQSPSNTARSRVILPYLLPSQNTVYILNQKKAVQSNIYFLMKASPYENSQQYLIDAFNKYFGGDMSSLVFQEIREFRSLAYSTYAQYTEPFKQHSNALFLAYVGCQNDKTVESVETMMELIKKMPQKTERMPSVIKALKENNYLRKPHFRELIATVNLWKEKGYTEDPRKINSEKYNQLNWQQMYDFYLQHIQNKPMAIAITGPVSKINIKYLEKYGKLVYIKENEIIK